MKHIFVVNPGAGPFNAEQEIRHQLALCDAEAQIYVTAAPGDATRYVRSVCQQSDQPVRFYACGGDGTLNEVLQGVMGFPHAALGCYPCGSGNDYVKYYGGKEPFLSVPDLLDAPTRPVDVIKVNDRYAINACDVGFDSAVCEAMEHFRRYKWLSGRRAYFAGIVKALCRSMKTRATLTADGETLNPDGVLLLSTMACGTHVGGSFKCAPRSKNDDGWLEVCTVRPVSRFRFVSLVGLYARGEHLDDPKLQKILTYRRAKRVTIQSPALLSVVLDGELLRASEFTVEVLPQVLSFVVPDSVTLPVSAEAEREPSPV